MAWRIGIDSGGRFTDICLFEEQSRRVGAVDLHELALPVDLRPSSMAIVLPENGLADTANSYDVSRSMISRL